MPSDSKLDPTGERAQATEAVAATPISGKAHEYRADGDHRPRQDPATLAGGRPDAAGRSAAQPQAAPEAGVAGERHIGEGIPGAGRSTDPGTGTGVDAQRDRDPKP